MADPLQKLTIVKSEPLDPQTPTTATPTAQGAGPLRIVKSEPATPPVDMDFSALHPDKVDLNPDHALNPLGVHAPGARPWYEPPPARKSGVVVGPPPTVNRFPLLSAHPEESPNFPKVVQAAKDFGDTLPELAGMAVAPELLGPMEGLPFLTRITSRMLASGAGATAGKVVEDVASGAPPSVEKYANTAATGAALEGAPAAAIAGAKAVKAGAPLDRTLNWAFGPPTVAGQEARDVIGHSLSAGQARNSPILTWVEQRLRGMIGGGPLRESTLKAFSQLDERTSELLSKVGTTATPEEAGQAYQSALSEAERAAHTAASDKYAETWQAAKDAGVTQLDLTPVFKRGQELANELPAVGRASGAQQQAGRAVNAAATAGEGAAEESAITIPGEAYARRAIEQLSPFDPRRAGLLQDLESALPALDHPTTATPEQVHRLKSFYGSMTRTLEGKAARGPFAQLAKAADDVLKQLPPDVRASYDSAQKAYREYSQTFKDGILAKVLDHEDPRQITDLIIKPGRVADIEKAQEALGGGSLAKGKSSPGWQKVQAYHLEQLLDDPTKLAGKTGEIAKLGDETLRAIYPASLVNGIHQLGRVAEQLTAHTPPAMTWGVALQMSTAGAATLVMKPLTAGEVIASTTIAPAALAKVLANDQARSALVAGLKAGNTPIGAKLTGQLLTFLRREGLLPGAGAPSAVKPRPATSRGPAPGATTPVNAPAGRGPGAPPQVQPPSGGR